MLYNLLRGVQKFETVMHVMVEMNVHFEEEGALPERLILTPDEFDAVLRDAYNHFNITKAPPEGAKTFQLRHPDGGTVTIVRGT
jgi:hypothetical protein